VTRVLTLEAAQPDHNAIAEAAAALRAGGLVAFPTETVYGLGANGLDVRAVERIFAAKGRPANDPLILHLGAAAQMALVALDVPPLAQTLAAAFWPGPLTLVLRRAPIVPLHVTAGRETVAVRVPAHPVALALIAAAGVPVAAPSANLFSRPSPTTAADVLEDLDGRIDLLLDGGPTLIGVESTVLDLTTPAPTLLRPGGTPLEAIEAQIGPVLLPGEATIGDDAPAPAPGMLLKHYSPRACLVYVVGPAHALDRALRQEVVALVGAGQRVGLLLPDEQLAALGDVGLPAVSLGPRADLAGVAQRLFHALRALDRQGLDAIVTCGYGEHGLGRALHDRLYRAAEGRVVEADHDQGTNA
jgi:L-threonylcarbamoyladenylate synthase